MPVAVNMRRVYGLVGEVSFIFPASSANNSASTFSFSLFCRSNLSVSLLYRFVFTWCRELWVGVKGFVLVFKGF